MTPLDLEPQTLAAVLQTPMMVALAWMMHGLRRGLHDRHDAPQDSAHGEAAALGRTRDELAAFKVEVARIYVPLSLIRDVDQRLSRQLLRIEEKLDAATRAATTANALQAAQRGWRTEDRS